MVTITNWWGIFFSFGIPIITMFICSYYAGVQQAEERQKKRVVQKALCNYSKISY